MEAGARSAAEEVAFEAKLAFLGSLEAFLGRTGADAAAPGAVPDLVAPAGRAAAVERIETHLSWLFIAGDRVFKLKKPIRLEFLDFSTVELRERDCREEVRLNRRLAPDVYLGVVALVAGSDGTLALVEDGAPPPGARTVDWLVMMRRLPSARMLDRAIRQGTVELGDVDRLGALLAGFYRGLPACEITADAFIARFAREQRYNRVVLTRPEFALDGWRGSAALDRVDRALHALRPALARCADSGCVVEGHGDLRPEHVCLLRPPVVIDCLEFDRALRLVDPLEELAFLGLECEMEGAAWIGPRLLRCCSVLSRDAPPALLRFYKAHRALVRARLALAHLLEPEPRRPHRWVPLARRYVDVALADIDRVDTAGSTAMAAAS
ncbi:MAG: hypothetical protein JSW68_04415 [Burkholderiales bacterium]|nr:MAG: hypothetical protein JSW68_04415 [Burkholderiales bacterium]